MNSGYQVRRIIMFVTFVFCAGLLLAVLPPASQARKNKSQLTVRIGQPNVWSLAQAHYLLANMRQNNRAAKVEINNANIDPTVANGARVDVLRTLLGAEVQYSGVAGTQNRQLLQKYEAEYARRQVIQTNLDQTTQLFMTVSQELFELKLKVAKLPADSSEAKELNALITQKTAEKQVLDDQIKALTPQLATAPTLGTLSSAAPFSSPAPGVSALPDDLTGLLKNLDPGAPKLNASTALDSYIQMQYELIAKQLTLLRDEVGPGQRLIFLELPSDLYSVPDKDDHYLVQMEWKANKYFGDLNHSEAAEEAKSQRGRSQQYPITLEVIDKYNSLKDSLLKNASKNLRADDLQLAERIVEESIKPTDTDASKIKAYPIWQKLNEMGKYSQASLNAEQKKDLNEYENETSRKLVEQADLVNSLQPQEQARIRQLSEFVEFVDRYPDLWNKGYKELPAETDKTSTKFRVVDIIPRQSALNITDVHAKQQGFAFTARFLALMGLGGQVNYQRQRMLYEQFLQQDVYASGFGKGQTNFGWTFGPLPGTDRLAPGVRTTHAILAVPKDALEIDLLVSAKAYHREDSPDDTKAFRPIFKEPQRIRILVPSESTQGFWLDEAIYTPVKKGERVTVLLRGKYFSPLTGVLIEGVPLKRAVALAKHESDSTTLPSATDPFGEFEYLNPNEIILSFKMSDGNYTGTPIITLVTPEKTGTINYYPLRINYHRHRNSLLDASENEPMFLEPLGIDEVRLLEFPSDANKPIKVRLLGRGFRPPANIFIDDNNKQLGNNDAHLLSTSAYELTFKPKDRKKWRVTYRYGALTAIKDFELQPPTIEGIENSRTGKAEGTVDGNELVIIRGQRLQNVKKVWFGSEAATIERIDGRVLFVKSPPAKAQALGKVQVIVENEWQDQNLPDFTTPGKAIYEYLASSRPVVSLAPSIASIENPTTGKAEGATAGGEIVTIRGANLSDVGNVLFGLRRAIIIQKDAKVLFVRVPPGDGGVQVFIELKARPKQPKLTNIRDFETPGKAIYKYIRQKKE